MRGGDVVGPGEEIQFLRALGRLAVGAFVAVLVGTIAAGIGAAFVDIAGVEDFQELELNLDSSPSSDDPSDDPSVAYQKTLANSQDAYHHLGHLYFRWFLGRDFIGFWFNLLAAGMLLAVGLGTYRRGDPAAGGHAVELAGPFGMTMKLSTRSLGLVVMLVGAAVVSIMTLANRPDADVLRALKDASGTPAEIGKALETQATPGFAPYSPEGSVVP